MGHNPSRNPFRQRRLEQHEQAAVDEYKARSVWGRWWSLSEEVRRRYFTADERKFMRRYGARLDELASLAVAPRNADEEHFLEVCARRAEPRNARERLWLIVRLVCLFEESLDRAARTDVAEHQAAALYAENRSLRRELRENERDYMEILGHLQMIRGDDGPPKAIGNVSCMTPLFRLSTSLDRPMFAYLTCQ